MSTLAFLFTGPYPYSLESTAWNSGATIACTKALASALSPPFATGQAEASSATAPSLG